MAEMDEDKKHPPSARKLARLKSQGTVMRSKDSSAALSISVFVILFVLQSRWMWLTLSKNFRRFYEVIPLVISGKMSIDSAFKLMIYSDIKIIFFFPIMLAIASLFCPFIIGGWNFTMEPLGFQLNRLNPVNYFNKIISLKKMGGEIIKSFFKSIFIFLFAIAYIWINRNEIMSVMHYSSLSQLPAVVSTVSRFMTEMLVFIGLFALLDILVVRHTFMREHGMTTRELEDESRESEGSPETKRRIRSMRMALMRQRISVLVPQAAVVITNPEHYAVALQYRPQKDLAPKLLVKGKGLLAAEIRKHAISSRVPVYQAPPVARAIYHTVKSGRMISPDLYRPVAIILSWLIQLEKWQRGEGSLPEHISDFDLPDRLKFKE